MFGLYQKGVYMIVFPGGEFYIGSAYGKQGILGRWLQHRRGYVDSPKYLQEVAKRYGGWSGVKFYVLRFAETKHRCLLWEQAYIHKSWKIGNKDSMLLNKKREIFEGPSMIGENNPTKRPEVRRKMSENHRDVSGKNSPMRNPETRRKVSLARLGFVQSEETKAKLSAITLKQWEDPKYRELHSGENSPTKRTEVRRKMSENHRDISGENSPSAKLTWEKVFLIRQFYISSVYNQIELANMFGVCRNQIDNIIKYKSWKLHKGKVSG